MTPEFDLRLTLESGQVFHWLPDGDGWIGLIDRTPVRVEQVGKRLRISKGHEQLVHHYFALDHPLEEIYATFPTTSFREPHSRLVGAFASFASRAGNALRRF